MNLMKLIILIRQVHTCYVTDKACLFIIDGNLLELRDELREVSLCYGGLYIHAMKRGDSLPTIFDFSRHCVRPCRQEQLISIMVACDY